MENSKKIFEKPDEEINADLSNCDLSPGINWVYGIRNHDIKQFIEYVKTDKEQLLIYFCGKIAIIYNLKSHEQRHYNDHKKEIISITSYKSMIATG